LGNGDGTFQPARTYLSGGYAATTIVVADLNNDGRVDLVVGQQCGDRDCSGKTVVGVLLGNGDGTFQTAVSYGSGGYGGPYDDRGPTSIAVGDVNRDGKADIIVANELVQKNRFDKGDALVGVLLGNGDGTFQTAQTYSSGGFVANSITLQDFNGDGKIDLVVANLGQRVNRWSIGVVTIRLGRGDGTFSAAQRISHSSGNTSSIATIDVDGDGKLDLLIRDSMGVQAWLGVGDGTFRLPGPGMTSQTPGLSIAAADLNGDGRPDVSIAQGCINYDDCTPGVGVLLNAVPYATTTELSSYQSPTVYGQSVVLTATVVTDGPFAPTGTVVFKNGGAGIGHADVIGGKAVLTKNNLPSGSLTITALYHGDTNLATSTSNALTQVVKMASSTTTVQSSVNPSVQGESVKFSAMVGSPTAKITGTVTFTAGTMTLGTVTLSGGKASITTTVLTPGSNKITATYNGTNNILGSAASLNQIVK